MGRGRMGVTVEGLPRAVPSGQGADRGYAWPYPKSRFRRTAPRYPHTVS
ncbi:hypothetical protein GCM10010317_015760 [Streptomyces mirabilis]|nr:hypothetical protein GCM10010317_015760 [Streptomyces mirabilis]